MALVAAAAAAIKKVATMKNKSDKNPQVASGVLLASLLLPGLASLAGLSALAPLNAAAENAPEKTTLGFKYGTYKDWQPGLDRVTVNAPQIYVLAPIAGEWSVEGSWVSDSVSGASPRWHTQHTQISGASRMSDERKAGDVKVTRYLARAAVSGSVAYSKEHDYTSRALGLDARWSSDDNNRTWSIGFGNSSDVIDNTYSGGSIVNRHKRTNELMAGVTQVLTSNDIVQFNLTRSVGSGFYDDPYKSFDQRPGQRDAWIGLARWNHHVAQFDAAVRSNYRYYSDTFGVQSHTLGMEWVQPAGRWSITPGVRYYTQSAANFYLDPILDAQGQYDQIAAFTRGIKLFGTNQSTDQRLAAFGGITFSMKLAYSLTPQTLVDFKLENYRQTEGLRIGGGSLGLDAFYARFMQVGLTHRF